MQSPHHIEKHSSPHSTSSRCPAAGATRRVALAVAAISVALLLAACGAWAKPSTSASGGAIRAGGDLRAALTGERDVPDPATSSRYTRAQVSEGIFSKLIDLDASGKFTPDLAMKWTQADPTTWTFSLVTNATLHNGEKFSSADVKYTFERILNPKTASADAGLYAQIDSIDATDPATVVFHLTAPFGPFLTNLATNGEIVNQKAIESSDPACAPIGTGPFTVVRWVQGNQIPVNKNPTYFANGLPQLDSISYRFLPVDQSRIDALSAFEID